MKEARKRKRGGKNSLNECEGEKGMGQVGEKRKWGRGRGGGKPTKPPNEFGQISGTTVRREGKRKEKGDKGEYWGKAKGE